MERAKRRTGGRPAKPEQDRQNVVITVRVTGKEHAGISAAAKAREISVSSFLRELGLGERRRSPVLAMELFELADRVERLIKIERATGVVEQPQTPHARRRRPLDP